MDNIDLKFEKINYIFPLVHVKGTDGREFTFGEANAVREIIIKDFYLSKFTVTQQLYEHVMGSNPSNKKGNNIPVECVSYDDIVMKGGFLEKINATIIKEEISKGFDKSGPLQFRLPSEAEWEYAAKGGVHWNDRFTYSGSNNIDEVAWYKDNSLDESEVVGKKKPNQLGIYDLSGNVWEWCQDYYHADINKTPADGSPCIEKSDERVLRGGCFHNWAIHCTSTKRYYINPDYKDPCIGFRLLLSFHI